MKGYSTAAGYMGYVAWMGKYILFSTDEEYREKKRKIMKKF